MTTEALNTGAVVSVNVSEAKGESKRPVSEIRIDLNGIAGDAHAGPWHRQVSLLAQESIDRFATASTRTFNPGDFAENITTRGLDLTSLQLLDRLTIGTVELEVTQIGKACHGDGCAIYQQVGKCVMPKEGIFCRVIQGGVIRPDDLISHAQRTLRCRLITLSDRAFEGVYPDRSGPTMHNLLGAFCQEKGWALHVESELIPDEAERLRSILLDARYKEINIVFTTGGTGIGPRDVAPEVVMKLADKLIPGIMDHIRLTCGATLPSALLSRSVAAVMGRTLVYALPGSVKAVTEYLAEIFKTLEHALFMLRGLDTH